MVAGLLVVNCEFIAKVPEFKSTMNKLLGAGSCVNTECSNDNIITFQNKETR